MFDQYDCAPLNTATKNILIVDDDSRVLILIKAVLNMKGQSEE